MDVYRDEIRACDACLKPLCRAFPLFNVLELRSITQQHAEAVGLETPIPTSAPIRAYVCLECSAAPMVLEVLLNRAEKRKEIRGV